jgi:hypothetical protein
MSQFVLDTQELAIEQGRDTGEPFVVYYDPELDGYGMYTIAALTGKGQWVKHGYIVYNSTEEETNGTQ